MVIKSLKVYLETRVDKTEFVKYSILLRYFSILVFRLASIFVEFKMSLVKAPKNSWIVRMGLFDV